MIITVFVIQSEFTGWYRSGLLHELATIEILVISNQTSVRVGDVTLLSWREWWEDITDVGWLTLCSPPHTETAQARFLKKLTTVPFSLHVCDLFLLHLHGTQATSIPFQCFPLIGVQISCLAQRLKNLFHVLSLTNHVWWTWFFLISCVEAWLFLISFAMEVYQLA